MQFRPRQQVATAGVASVAGPLLGLDFFVLRWAGDLLSFLLDSVVSVEVRGTFEKPEFK